MVASITAIAGCQAADDDDGSAGSSGGTASQVVSIDLNTWDPGRITSLSPSNIGTWHLLVYGYLLYNPVDGGEVGMGFAESLEPDDDTGTQWTLTLKDGITFTDGTAYDAAAVKYNWDRFADPETGAANAAAAQLLTTEVVDPLTLSIGLEEPNFFIDRLIASQLNLIVSPTAVENDPEVFVSNPVGAGPFIPDEAVPGSYYTFVRNDEYYEEGKPYLDGVTLRVISDRGQVIQSVLAGESDIDSANGWDRIAQYAEDDDLVIKTSTAGGARVILLNHERPPFDDPRAREALLLAVNGDDVANIGEPADGSEAPTHLFNSTSIYFDEEQSLHGFDPERAQELFDELAAEGKPVEFTFTGFTGSTAVIVEYIVARLNEYDNVQVDIEPITFPTYQDQVVLRREYQAVTRPGIVFVTAPVPGLEQILRTDAKDNLMGYSSAETDALLDSVRATNDLEEQRAIIAQIHELFLADNPFWAYGTPANFVAHSKELTDVEAFEEGYIRWDNVKRSD